MSEDISEKRDKALKVLIYGFNAVITPLNSDELLKKIADSIKKLLKADNVTVQISEQVERQEALVGGSHSTNAGADQVKTLEEDVESLSEIQIYHPTVPGSYSELSIPLVTNRGVFGVLNIELETNKENANLSQSDLEALRALTDMVVIAIQAAHSTQKLAATKRNLRLLLKTSSNSDSKLNPLFFKSS